MYIQYLIATKKTRVLINFSAVTASALDLLTQLTHHFPNNLKLNLAILYKQNLDNLNESIITLLLAIAPIYSKLSCT